MDRTACVEVPALPLQVLVLRRPGWATGPAAVVDRDHPHGRVLWANARARHQGVAPSMRYVTALAAEPGLRAATVPPAEVARWRHRILRRLLRFTPGVEPWDRDPGVFWLDASGLGRLHPEPARWAAGIRRELAGLGLAGRVAVGFTRCGALAAVRSGRARIRVLRSPGEEAAGVRGAPLARLGAEPGLAAELGALGVRTAGDLLALPAASLAERFGPAARALHRFVSGRGELPLQPIAPPEPLRVGAVIEPPEADLHRLVFRIKGLLDDLLGRMGGRGMLLAELEIHLRLEGGTVRTERLRPAAPTRDARQLMNLVHLRLAGAGVPAGVEEVVLSGRAVPARPTQAGLFQAAPRRDPEAALRALARVRAELGEGAVVRARLADRHLPEARFAWEPLEDLPPARPREVALRPLVRRILDRPAPLAEPAGQTRGGYVVSGGWWGRGTHREYRFVRLAGGEILWAFHDQARGRWFRQGTVE